MFLCIFLFQTILWHLLHHVPQFLLAFGPLHSYWMFYFERLIHGHVSRLHSRKNPEASMIKAYKVSLILLYQYLVPIPYPFGRRTNLCLNFAQGLVSNAQNKTPPDRPEPAPPTRPLSPKMFTILVHLLKIPKIG